MKTTSRVEWTFRGINLFAKKLEIGDIAVFEWNGMETKGAFLSDKNLVYNYAYNNVCRGYGILTVTAPGYKTREKCKPCSDL